MWQASGKFQNNICMFYSALETLQDLMISRLIRNWNGPHGYWSTPLQWRHNDLHGVSNHQLLDCLLNHLFKHRSKKTSKLRVTGLCVGNSPVTGEFPAQKASNAENVPIWWRHHDNFRPIACINAIWQALIEPTHLSSPCSLGTAICDTFRCDTSEPQSALYQITPAVIEVVLRRN